MSLRATNQGLVLAAATRGAFFLHTQCQCPCAGPGCKTQAHVFAQLAAPVIPDGAGVDDSG